MTYFDDDDPRIRALREQLGALPTEQTPPPEVLLRLRDNLRPRHRVVSAASGLRLRGWGLLTAGLAAGIVLGFIVGRRTPVQGATLTAAPGSWAAAVDVQRTGTAYVTAVARLGRYDPAMGPAVTQGREAAVTVLFGAALAYAQQAPDDPSTLDLLRAVQRARNAVSAPRAIDQSVRF